MDYKKLEHDMELAAQAALAYAETEDDGTCNFDTPYLVLKGVRYAKMKDLFDYQYGCYKWDNSRYHIGGKLLRGQANRRTQMAEAFAKSLRNNGWEAFVYYQMD